MFQFIIEMKVYPLPIITFKTSKIVEPLFKDKSFIFVIQKEENW